MRENMGLYRGKRKDNGKWEVGNLFENDNYNFPMVLIGHVIMSRDKHFPQDLSFDGYYLVEVDPETVGQFTGMTDKNRKKIFEGDIVQTIKTEFKPPRKYKKPFHVHYNSDFPITVEEYYSPFEHFTEKVAYEVVGNIHDNPELLQEV